MPRPPLPFVRHCTANELHALYQGCRHPVEKMRWHALWLLARTDEPRTPTQVAEMVGLSAVTVRDVLNRWNAQGPAGVSDRRKGNGALPKLTSRHRDELSAALQGLPPDGGTWTAPKVVRYVRDRWNVVVRPETGWRWLRKLGFALRVPHHSALGANDPPAHRAWQKTSGGGSC